MKNNPDVKFIIEQYLKDNEYDGLYTNECGCSMKEGLFPCGDIPQDCKAGYFCGKKNKDSQTGRVIYGCAHGCIVAEYKNKACCNDYGKESE